MGDPWPVLLDPNSQSQGLITELVRTALLSQGYELEMNFVPWSRGMVTIKNNKIDLLLGAWHTKKRNEYLLYSEPIFSSAIIFVKHIDSAFEYQGISSLSGFRSALS